MEAKNWIIIEHNDERFREGMKKLDQLNNSHPFKEDWIARFEANTALLVFANILEERSVPCPGWIPEGTV
jgi:hypothetical protein